MEAMEPLASWSWHSSDAERGQIWWMCVLLNACFVLSAVLLLNGIEAPYGRYHEAKQGENPIMRTLKAAALPSKVAWFIQESPTVCWAAWCLFTAEDRCRSNPGNMVVLACFVVHYLNRTFIFPLRSRGSKPIPLPVMFMAFIFCMCNGYIQCHALTRHSLIELSAPSTLFGVAIWALGFYWNLEADDILRNLRKPGETGYKIPKGGLFDYVSGANFAAEILEWFGFFVASGFSLPAFTFAFCTISNIGPRSMSHHKWYKEKFEDYPKERKALIPFIW